MTSVPDLNTEIDAQLPTNATGQITASRLRTVLHDMTNSLGGGASGGGIQSFPTYADFAGAGTWDGGVKIFRTSGYYSPGDGGGATYIDYGVTNPNLPLGGAIQDSVNGRWLMQAPVNGVICPNQFGARPMFGTNRADGTINNYTDATTYDSTNGIYACLNFTAFNPLGNCDIQFGPGTYYTTKEVSLRGFQGDVSGFGSGLSGSDGTWLRPASNVSGIIIQHQNWSVDVFGVIYGNNKTYPLGTTIFNGTEIYTVTVAGTTASSGSGPTGFGSAIVNGSVTFAWVRTKTRYEQTSQGWSGAIRRFNIFSHWDRVHDPYRQSFGIMGRSRGIVENCWVGNFSAHGIAFIANGDPDFPTLAGNVNGFQIENCACYYNGLDAYHASYSDGNAGYIRGCDAGQNGRWAYGMFDFLGTTVHGCETAYDGVKIFNVTQYPNGVTSGGYNWKAREPRVGVETTTVDYTQVPGSASGTASWWICVAGDGTSTPSTDFPAHSTSGTYEPGGSICIMNANSRGTVSGLYIEGSNSTAQLGQRAFSAGGITSNLITPSEGAAVWTDGAWYNSVQVARYETRTTGPANSYGFVVNVGPAGSVSQTLNRRILTWNDYFHTGDSIPRNTFSLDGISPNVDNATNIDYKLKWNNSQTVFTITGKDTLETFGSGASVAQGIFWVDRLAIDGVFGSKTRIITSNGAAPSSGTWGVGTVCFNATPVVGQPKAWSCTVAGTPGTWVSWGNL
jgi:hypothetical protein